MTPDQLSTITAIVALFKSIGTWPVLSIVTLVILAPWIILVALSWSQHQRFETMTVASGQRFESVVRMYEDNITLVNEITDLAKGYSAQLVWSTQIATEAKDIAKNNLYCPVVRRNSRPKDIAG